MPWPMLMLRIPSRAHPHAGALAERARGAHRQAGDVVRVGLGEVAPLQDAVADLDGGGGRKAVTQWKRRRKSFRSKSLRSIAPVEDGIGNWGFPPVHSSFTCLAVKTKRRVNCRTRELPQSGYNIPLVPSLLQTTPGCMVQHCPVTGILRVTCRLAAVPHMFH